MNQKIKKINYLRLLPMLVFSACTQAKAPPMLSVNLADPSLAKAMAAVTSKVAAPGGTNCAPDANGVINVITQCGAVADGTTDATAAIQAALNAAGNVISPQANLPATRGGGQVFLPSGTYKISGALDVPAYVTLKGIYHAPVTAMNVVGAPPVPVATTAGTNTLILAFNTTSSLFTMHNGAAIESLMVYYPNQNMNSPVPYPATIYKTTNANEDPDGLVVQNVMLLNPWIGIDFSGAAGGRHYIHDLYGQPLSLGILIDHNYDAGRIEGVSFGPFWSASNTLAAWQTQNTVAIQINRSDGELVRNIAIWGGKYGLLISQSDAMGPYGDFENIFMSGVATAIRSVAGSRSQVGVRINHLTTNSGIDQNGGDLQITNSTIGGAAPVRVNTGTLNLAHSQINYTGNPSVLVAITAGRVILVANTFQAGSALSVQVAAAADEVMITDNLLNGNHQPQVDPACYLPMVANNR